MNKYITIYTPWGARVVNTASNPRKRRRRNRRRRKAAKTA